MFQLWRPYKMKQYHDFYQSLSNISASHWNKKSTLSILYVTKINFKLRFHCYCSLFWMKLTNCYFILHFLDMTLFLLFAVSAISAKMWSVQWMMCSLRYFYISIKFGRKEKQFQIQVLCCKVSCKILIISYFLALHSLKDSMSSIL